MNQENTSPPRTFKIGGEIEVNRLGFGAMRITGRGIWGAPEDRAEAIRTLRRLPELGINLIDTADSYGPNVSEELICEALHPYSSQMLIATKAGLTRSGPDLWSPQGRPEYLIQQAKSSCERLGVEKIDLWQLHRIDPKVPRDEQFGAIRQLLDEGVIRHVGLSEVSILDIKQASKTFKVSTVQNRFNLIDRNSSDVVDYCTAEDIGFIPWYPLAAGSLIQPGKLLNSLCHKLGSTPGQIAIAWLLKRSPVIMPIPGTSKQSHLEHNVDALHLHLSDEDYHALEALTQES